jgi:hypothetical protein
MRFDLSGRSVIEATPTGDVLDRYFRSQFAPFVPTETSAPATVVIQPESAERSPIVEFQGPANDDLVTATDGERLYVMSDGLRCTVPNALDGTPLRFDYDPGFPIWRIFRQTVRPALQVSLVAGGSVAVHASSVEIDGRGVLVSGWSESGKTETALAMMESGARFVSDKWTIIGQDRELSAFPINVGVRRWVLEYLPTLKSSITLGARAQFAVARIGSVLLAPAGRGRARNRATAMIRDAARLATALGDRAAFSAKDIREAYGQVDDPTRRVPTRAVIVLVSVPGSAITTEPADPAWAAARLARSAAYERRSYFGLLQRAGFASIHRPSSVLEAAIEREESLLRSILEGCTVVAVRAPFPTDPTRVADAIARAI